MSDHTDTLTDTEREVASYLAEEAFQHSWDTSDERQIDDVWVAGLCCECGEFVPYGQEVAHVAAALAPIVAARVAAARAEAWERGAFAGREFQKRLYEYVHPTNISAKQPEMPPNPYRALIEGADQ